MVSFGGPTPKIYLDCRRTGIFDYYYYYYFLCVWGGGDG